MKKSVLLAGMMFCLMTPSFASALDNLSDPNLGVAVVKPHDMTCQQFEKANADLQLFVSAWYDGDSTGGNVSDVEYSKADVLSMQEHLFSACDGDPEATLEELEFNYGGEDDDYRDPSCSFLLGMKDQREAWTFLSWAVGYFAQDRRVFTINVAEFVDMSNSLIKTCLSSPRANVMEEMQSYLKGSSSRGGSSASGGPASWNKDIENI